MRRVAVESLLVGAAVAVAVAAWFAPEIGAVCGAEGAATAWRVGQLQAWWSGVAPLADDAGVPVPVAGLPYVGFAALLAPAFGLGGAWLSGMMLAVAGGAAALWGLSRAAGGSPLAAGLAVAVGAAPPALAAALGEGGVDLAVVPFAALALALLPKKGRGARALGFAAVVACGLCDARTGAIVGLAAAAAGGGGWALFAALLATGTGAAAPGAGTLDVVDLPAPFVLLRPDALAPGLAVVAGALWGLGESRLRWGALVAFVCALGPVLAAFGDVLTVSGAAVPLPAVLVAAFTPDGVGWSGALVVAAVATALGLGRASAPRLSLLLAPLALLEAGRAAGPAPACVPLDAPVAIRALAERDGGVLNLPVRVVVDGVARGAPAPAHGLYLVQRRLHGRPLATGAAPLGASDPLYGEPAVVLALGADTLLLPPTRPGEVLRGLGITEIVVHRRLFAPGALGLVDPVLAKLYGAPQRDHAADIDLYRVAATGSMRTPTAESLRTIDDAPPPGWLDLGAYLAGLAPVGGSPPAGAEGAAPPEPAAAGAVGPPEGAGSAPDAAGRAPGAAPAEGTRGAAGDKPRKPRLPEGSRRQAPPSP
jgi:hypothetical protein